MKNKFELLPPFDLVHHLLVRKQQLEQLLPTLERKLSSAPEGRLRISKSHGALQYYQVGVKTGKQVYLSKKKLPLIKNLAQKTYNKEILTKVKKQLLGINELLSCMENNRIEEAVQSLPESRKGLLEPVTLPDKEYIRRWNAIVYQSKPFLQGVPAMFTSRGERVRSKSEILIADTLARLGIPYRYEWPIQLADFKVYPDFYCLNLRTREEIAWEHFGMVDNSDYAEKMVYKLENYEKSNFHVGRNLIISLETTNHPITIKNIEQKIHEYLV